MYKKSILAFVIGMLLIQANVYAEGHWALQGDVATAGNIGLNLAHYENTYEFGAGIGGLVNNSSNITNSFTVIAFVGLRNYIAANTVFAYGLDFSTKFGKKDGQKINSAFGTGPFISIEQYFTNHLLTSVWINPYFYDYEKKADVGTTTHRFLSSGGLGIAYVF